MLGTHGNPEVEQEKKIKNEIVSLGSRISERDRGFIFLPKIIDMAIVQFLLKL